MSSLVLQLQGECLDSSVSILEILRKALVVAQKLGVKDFQAWAERELNGYGNAMKAAGDPKWKNKTTGTKKAEPKGE
jgi:hypothetical protein